MAGIATRKVIGGRGKEARRVAMHVPDQMSGGNGSNIVPVDKKHLLGIRMTVRDGYKLIDL